MLKIWIEDKCQQNIFIRMSTGRVHFSPPIAIPHKQALRFRSPPQNLPLAQNRNNDIVNIQSMRTKLDTLVKQAESILPPDRRGHNNSLIVRGPNGRLEIQGRNQQQHTGINDNGRKFSYPIKDNKQPPSFKNSAAFFQPSYQNGQQQLQHSINSNHSHSEIASQHSSNANKMSPNPYLIMNKPALNAHFPPPPAQHINPAQYFKANPEGTNKELIPSPNRKSDLADYHKSINKSESVYSEGERGKFYSMRGDAPNKQEESKDQTTSQAQKQICVNTVKEISQMAAMKNNNKNSQNEQRNHSKTNSNHSDLFIHQSTPTLNYKQIVQSFEEIEQPQKSREKQKEKQKQKQKEKQKEKEKEKEKQYATSSKNNSKKQNNEPELSWTKYLTMQFKNQQLQKSIKSVQTQLARECQQVEKLNASLSQKEKEHQEKYSSLSKHYNEKVNTQKEHYEKMILEKKKHIQELVEKCDLMRQGDKVVAMENYIRGIVQENERVNLEVKELRIREEESKSRLVKSQGEVERMRHEIAVLSEQLRAQKENCNSLKEQLSKNKPEFEQIIKTQIAESSSKREHFQILQDENMKLKETIRELQHSISVSKSETVSLELKEKSLKNKLMTEMSIVINNKDNQIQSLSRKLETLEEKYKMMVVDVKNKDQFVQQYLVGRSNEPDVKKYIREVMDKYRSKFQKKDREEEYLQEIQRLKGKLALFERNW